MSFPDDDTGASDPIQILLSILCNHHTRTVSKFKWKPVPFFWARIAVRLRKKKNRGKGRGTNRNSDSSSYTHLCYFYIFLAFIYFPIHADSTWHLAEQQPGPYVRIKMCPIQEINAAVALPQRGHSSSSRSPNLHRLPALPFPTLVDSPLRHENNRSNNYARLACMIIYMHAFLSSVRLKLLLSSPLLRPSPWHTP